MKKIIVFLGFVFALNIITANAQTVNNLIAKINNIETKKFDHLTGKYLEVDGANIYYEEIKNKGKPVLLFLHGGFGNIESFNTVIPLFTNDFHIIGIDSRGHGKSTLGTDKLNYERLQADVESVLKHLQINEVSIIGFSDGGIVGYRLAAANKTLVNRLITIGATWSLDDVILMENLMATVTPETLKEIFAQDFEFYQKKNPQPDFIKFAKCVMEMWCDKSEAGYPYASISEIEAPVLIVRGNDDEMFPLESAVKLTQKIKNSLLLNIPFAPHEAFKKYPHIFEIITREFLQK
ncbi:MAG: alpha/beta hydrolase [Prevotellaceae bacterium]|jgi:pimeloyl-ACP methyl ester carboxylesterase|nr:alpha/beta hydrolase [Prevotellaceae bacterium]